MRTLLTPEGLLRSVTAGLEAEHEVVVVLLKGRGCKAILSTAGLTDRQLEGAFSGLLDQWLDEKLDRLAGCAPPTGPTNAANPAAIQE